ncbi:MAG: phosphoserine phosphatase SerB, partial [Actinomycetota bacterium]
GDGANDIEMIELADIGIAFCAKPALKGAADIVIDKRDLREIIKYL